MFFELEGQSIDVKTNKKRQGAKYFAIRQTATLNKETDQFCQNYDSETHFPHVLRRKMIINIITTVVQTKISLYNKKKREKTSKTSTTWDDTFSFVNQLVFVYLSFK